VSDERKVPRGRLGRLARWAHAGASGGLAMLRNGGSAEGAARILGQLRGVAAKVGQMASYVDGLVPEAHRETFEASMAKLRSQAPQSDPAQIRAAVAHELGRSVTEVFAQWDDTPIASASIGQVHRAVLSDGRAVAVKVRHPGIVQAMESDLRNAGLLEVAFAAMGLSKFEVGRLLEEARARFREELDYSLEGERYQAFAELHAGDPRIVIPAVIGSASASGVLTTELIEGIDFEAACAAAPETRVAWCETLWAFVYGSIMRGGMFNADPHPGNYLFAPDGKIGFVDFGCVQTVSTERRGLIVRAHRAAGGGDYPAFDDAAAQMLVVKPGEHRRRVLDYMHFALRPVFDAPFHVTRPYAAEVVERFKAMGREFAKLPAGEFSSMPPGILFLNRLQFGFFSILARLDVPVDYAAVERTWLDAVASELGV
jgi:predicted unusual protein kinase regulating ubiquinone biosynthesis (AarF/ABC1/UbiB family)